MLLRCLAVLARQTGRATPSLIDRYMFDNATSTDYLDNFSNCVKSILQFAAVTDVRIQQAINVIVGGYSNQNLCPHFVAESVKMRLPTLCGVFKRNTGITLSEYIRNVRLDEAACLLLTSTSMSIKEVWTAVGYNHASNFDHDFKARFDVTPTEHRNRTIQTTGQWQLGIPKIEQFETGSRKSSKQTETVLVIDDDGGITDILVSGLTRRGYAAFSASNGAAGIHEFYRICPDVVLIDFYLGDMNGLECLKTIRQQPQSCHSGVAIFTAASEAFNLEQEIRLFDAIITSKLCGIEDVERLVKYLSPRRNPRHVIQNG